MTAAAPLQEAELCRWLVRRVAQTAGIDERQVGLHRPLTELGLSSVQAVSLTAELGDLLGRRLPATLAWQTPTILALARHLTAGSADYPRHHHTGTAAPATPVAIVGAGCRLPGTVEGPQAFWEFLMAGGDGITDVPAGRWDAFGEGTPAAPSALAEVPRQGGFLHDIAGFDAEFFGITPREAALMDPQQRIVLEVVYSALEHAGIPAQELRGSRTGVFIGASSHEYGQLTTDNLAGIEAWTATGAAPSIIANRVSYLLDLRGPSMAIDTACSSSLVAVHQACRSLAAGEIDTAIVGGVNALLGPAITLGFSRAGVLAADGRCKTFDAAADGIARGEGCAVVVLKQLKDARGDGSRIMAVVRGSAVNSDGRSNGMMAPNVLAQQELLRDACASADIDASTVDYVEAHGTGTLL
ncbi:MAG: type I polyketide synthase, partial [Sciscionella sp.]